MVPTIWYRVGQLLHHRRIGLNDVQRDTFGGTRADTGESSQRRDQCGDGVGKVHNAKLKIKNAK